MDLVNSGEYIRETPTVRAIDPKSQESIDGVFQPKGKLPYTLPSGERILLSTLEVINVPLGFVGFICLRSTFARLGLISPPTVADPGFHGTLTMEIYNASKNWIIIHSGIAIWSIHYLVVPDTISCYRGRYQNQRGVTIPTALEDV